MAQGKLIGPADTEAKVKEDKVLIEEVKTGFSVSDFRPLSMESVRSVHPFEGYAHPMGKVTVIAKDFEGNVIGENLIHTAFVVAYLPTVAQDPSGLNYVVNDDYKMDEILTFGPYEGKTVEQVMKIDKDYATNLIRTGKQRRAPLKTSHTRALRDYQEMRNYMIVFDRWAQLKDGDMPNVGICPNHNLRAQLCYKLDERTGNIRVDTKYGLLDHQQRPRLLATYRMLVAPQLQNIRLQQVVTGEIQVAEGQTLADVIGEKE